MVMECSERVTAPSTTKLCQYDKIKCSSPSVNGSKFCSKHVLPSPSHQCMYIIRGQQCKNKISGTDQRTLCATHLAVKASRKRRRTEAPAHKDLLNKTPPLALHVFRIMTQERQRMKFKPNIYKRPLEHLKWAMKRERLLKNPTYPSGMEECSDQHDSQHEYLNLDEPIQMDQESMSDIRCRGTYLAQVESRIQHRLDSLVTQVNSLRRTQVDYKNNTKATIEAARANVSRTTNLLSGKEREAGFCACELPNKGTKYSCCMCSSRALPFTKYCTTHIIRDKKQLLFSNCKTSSPFGECNAPTPTVASPTCKLHSLLKKFGVTESQDIETESSSSESEAEDPIFEPSFHSSPSSPKPPVKRITPPLPPPESHHPVESSLDMLPMQPDTILENNPLPEEPDIPLSVRCLEPPPIAPPIKRSRSKEEEMRMQYMKYPGYNPGYYYPPYGPSYGGSGSPGVFIQGYNKEGEAIYGYHDQKYFPSRHSSSDNGSRPTTPLLNADMIQQQHFYQQQRLLQQSIPSPRPPSTPEAAKKPSPKPKKKAAQKRSNPKNSKTIKEQQDGTRKTAEKTNAKQVVPNADATKMLPNYTNSPQNVVTTPPNPHITQQRACSPNSVASPSTMAALKFKISDGVVKKDDIPEVETAQRKEDIKASKPVPSPQPKAKKNKNTPPKTTSNIIPPNGEALPAAIAAPQHLPGMMPQHPHTQNMMIGRQMTAAQHHQMQQNYIQYQHMYPNQEITPQHPYYLQMYMAQHPQQIQMAPQAAGHSPSPGPPPGPSQQLPVQHLPAQLSTTQLPGTQPPAFQSAPGPQPPEQNHKPGNKEQAAGTPKSESSQQGSTGTSNDGPELNEYQKYALQQQRQRQIMIAQNQMSAQYNYGTMPPQHYQYFGHQGQFAKTPPQLSPKVEKKKKKPPAKPKEDIKPTLQQQKITKKSSLNSPTANSKDSQLSSLQSLITTASSGRLPIGVLNDDPPPPSQQSTVQTDRGAPKAAKSSPRPKKTSKTEDHVGEGKEGEKRPPPTISPHVQPQHLQQQLQPIHPQHYYQMQGYPNALQGHVLMQMSPVKGYYLNGGGPVYFRVEETDNGGGPDNRFNDAVLARNRPSTILMKDANWRERYMSGKKSDQNDKKSGSTKGKLASPRDRRSPQKAAHRNLIFHNTEIGLYSDKLAKQQKNAEQKSHRATCSNKVKKPDVESGGTLDNVVKCNNQSSSYNDTHSLQHSLPSNLPDSNNPLQLSSQSDGIT